MDTFAVKFRAGSLDLNTIVTDYDHHRKFKVEMVTDEVEPILLGRSVKGEWTVVQRGTRHFSERDFEELENAIEAELNKKYGVKTMLVLTDFSDAALNAARYAAALTYQRRTSKLILYHFYHIPRVTLHGFCSDRPGIYRISGSEPGKGHGPEK